MHGSLQRFLLRFLGFLTWCRAGCVGAAPPGFALQAGTAGLGQDRDAPSLQTSFSLRVVPKLISSYLLMLP